MIDRTTDDITRAVTGYVRWVWHRHFGMRFAERTAVLSPIRRRPPTPELTTTIASALGMPEATPRARR